MPIFIIGNRASFAMIYKKEPGQDQATRYKPTIASAYQNPQLGVSEMAKAKTGVNKSEAIREAYKALPDAKAKEIVAHLKEKGIDVSEGLVYQVKKMSKKKKSGRKPGKVSQAKATVAAPTKTTAPSSNGVLGVGASIAVARAAAEKVGSWATLKEIVDAMR